MDKLANKLDKAPLLVLVVSDGELSAKPGPGGDPTGPNLPVGASSRDNGGDVEWSFLVRSSPCWEEKGWTRLVGESKTAFLGDESEVVVGGKSCTVAEGVFE